MKAAVTPQVAPQSAREGRDDGVGCMACAMASCEDGGGRVRVIWLVASHRLTRA